MPRAVTTDKVSLFYKDWGPADGRPIVLIHGWPLTGDTFDDVAVELAKDGYRSIIPDRRGFGRSDQPWDGYDYDTFADDVSAILDEAGVDGPVAIAGFSMGGGEVARFLTKNPGRISHAVLIASVVPYLLKSDDPPEGAPKEMFDGIIEAIKADRPAFFREFLKAFFGPGKVSDEVIDNAWRQAMMAGLKPTLACVRAFSETDFRPDLANFSMPTLIVHGVEDQTVPIDLTARAAAKAISHAKLIEYDDGAHGIFASHRVRLIGDMLEFLGA